MLKHFTYDGLGRLVRVQSPWPDVPNANGGVRSERFYYDGARRIQEYVTDPVVIIELLQTPEGGANNPELTELMNQTVPSGTLGSGDGSANPMSFESGQLENPSNGIGIGGDPLPAPLGGLEREYIWGPGDNGLDEILVQNDIERKAFWMIQDGGGDVVAMCDLAGAGGTARVVKSWQYDAYGQCLRATDVVASSSGYSIPINRAGHKGLFMDRLDVGLANSSTYADNPRLAPFSTVLYQNRNRTYSPQLGRFIQRDPNESGQLLAAMMGKMGAVPVGSGGNFGLEALYGDGGSLYGYLGSTPWNGSDPTGLEMTLGGLIGRMALYGAMFGATGSGLKSYANGDSARQIAGKAALGGVVGGVGGLLSGGMIGMGVAYGGGVLVLGGAGAVGNMLSGWLMRVTDGETSSWQDFATDGLIGGVSMGGGAAIAKYGKGAFSYLRGILQRPDAGNSLWRSAGIEGLPSRLARVIGIDESGWRPSNLSLGEDAFVCPADSLKGLNASQIKNSLKIAPPGKRGYLIIEFDTPKAGVGCPINRTNPGFVPGGKTGGGVPEFVVPPQIPPGATYREVH